MSGPSRVTLAANAAALGLLGWLYGGDVVDSVRARGAEVAAMTELPNLAFASAVLVLLVAAAVVALLGLVRRRGEDFKGYRLLPILATVVLFVDLFVLSADKLPFSSADLATVALGHFAELAQQHSDGRVSADPRQLEPLLASLGAPPYLVRGARPQAWRLVIRQGCKGPAVEAAGEGVGTLVYCVAPERAGAWLTAVGLPVEERFGAPAVITQAGEPRFAFVGPTAPEPVSAAAEEAPFRERGLPSP